MIRRTCIAVLLCTAVMLVCAAPALGYGAVWNSTDPPIYNPYKNFEEGSGYYLSWWFAEQFSDDGSTSPHGNYTTTSNKCRVCHTVHQADASGVMLTAWDGTTGTGEMKAVGSCMFCHGPSSTFTEKRIVAEHQGAFTLSPHESCKNCHTPSPHGSWASQYPILSAKLLNQNADAAIAADIATGANGLTREMFDRSDAAGEVKGLTLGTGYLCSYCHDSDGDPVTFAVNEYKATPTNARTLQPSRVTGHRAIAVATATWNENGEFGANFKGISEASGTGAVDGDSQIAFAPVGKPFESGCKSCHDAQSAAGDTAFPHGYVDATGAPVASADASGGAFIWMTIAGDADDPRITNVKYEDGTMNPDNSRVATLDGLCVKCHLSGDRTQGVGITF